MALIISAISQAFGFNGLIGGSVMKERPIIFNAEMVKAILDGRKMKTRRIIKPQPPKTHTTGWWSGPNTFSFQNIDQDNPFENVIDFQCPYGKVGDRLWVQHPFKMVDLEGEDKEAFAFTRARPIAAHYLWDDTETCAYVDEDGKLIIDSGGSPNEKDFKWNSFPAKNLPRAASPAVLEITDIRVERVQDISKKDMQNEGIRYSHTVPYVRDNIKEQWIKVWNSIYGPDAWDRNDWVWVIGFRKVSE